MAVKRKKRAKRAAKKRTTIKVTTRPRLTKTKRKPSTNGADGRNSDGQFAKGNRLSVGNKSHTNEKAIALKEAYINAITEDDIKKIVTEQISKAKKGNTIAAKEIFDRLWGRAKQEVELGENATNTLVDIVARMCGHGTGTD